MLIRTKPLRSLPKFTPPRIVAKRVSKFNVVLSKPKIKKNPPNPKGGLVYAQGGGAACMRKDNLKKLKELF